MFKIAMLVLGLLDETASTVMIQSLPSCSQWESSTHEVKWVFCLCQEFQTFDVCAGRADAEARFLKVYHDRASGDAPLLHMRLLIRE